MTLANYRKQALPNYGVFDEKRYFAAGDQNTVVDVAGVSVGITICEDCWVFGPVSAAANAGAQIVVNLNASPFDMDKWTRRESVLAERSREAGIPIVYVNLVGGQDELIFDGGSIATDVDGNIVARLPVFEEALEVIEYRTESEHAEPQGNHVTPYPDEAASVYKAVVLGIRDYVRKNGFSGVIIGCSGGIDSALTLALAVDALGAKQVNAVLMPSRYTSTMSIEDAIAEAQALDVAHQTIPIEPIFNAATGVLADAFHDREPDATEENIQARCRGMILMALSNKFGWLVLTTGNKSEMAVGYATLYGDMAGGFAPIKDCPKTLVYRLARYRNTLSPVIPERVLERPPSAELAPDQKDTDSLPSYDVLDPILEAFIEEDLSIEQIADQGIDREIAQRVLEMVRRSEYKRRQAPPGVRISPRGFGRDWRYPITSGYRPGSA